MCGCGGYSCSRGCSSYYYLVIDRDAGVFESIQQSWQLDPQSAPERSLVIYLLEIVLVLAAFWLSAWD